MEIILYLYLLPYQFESPVKKITKMKTTIKNTFCSFVFELNTTTLPIFKKKLKQQQQPNPTLFSIVLSSWVQFSLNEIKNDGNWKQNWTVSTTTLSGTIHFYNHSEFKIQFLYDINVVRFSYILQYLTWFNWDRFTDKINLHFTQTIKLHNLSTAIIIELKYKKKMAK